MTDTTQMTDLSAIVTGTGEPLVLAHGAGGSVAVNFGQVIDTLAPRRRLIGVDFPGSGDTPRQQGPLDLDHLADALVDAAVADGHHRFPILGLSLGCAVALTAARRHPDRVSGLFLTVGFAQPDAQIRLVIDVWRHLATTDPAMLARLLVALSAPHVLDGLDHNAMQDAVDDTFAALPAGGPDQALLAATVDVTDDAAAVTVPTTVVVAGQDRIVLPTTTRALARMIPGARLLEYPDAGHIFTAAEATRWIDDIVEFLNAQHL